MVAISAQRISEQEVGAMTGGSSRKRAGREDKDQEVEILHAGIDTLPIESHQSLWIHLLFTT